MAHRRAFRAVAGFLPAAGVGLLSVAGGLAAEKLKAEELVARHLDRALGPSGLRTGHDCAASGTSALSTRQVGGGVLAGAFRFDSTLLTSTLVLEFPASNTYDGEIFAFDGQDIDVGFGQRRPGQRSAVGSFVSANDVILREGLLGGVLNARWPLLDLAARQAKVRYEGLKKLDGRDLHRLSYRAKKGQADLDIHLYFDPETYHHLASVYSRSRAQNMGATIVDSSQESDVHFRLEERFANFTTVDGVSLPTVWTLRYETSSNTTVEWNYEFTATSIQRKARPAVSADGGMEL